MMVILRAIFQLLGLHGAQRNGVFPTSADTVAALAVTLTKNAAAWTWGAWAQVVLAAGVTERTEITGFVLENFVGVPAQGEVQIGFGTAPAGTVLGVYPITVGYFTLPRPIIVEAGNGVVARYRNANAVADTVDLKVLTRTGL